MIRRSLRLRVLLGSALWIALSLGIGGYVIVATFERAALNQFDQRLQDELTLLSVGIASIADDPGSVMVSPSFQRVYSGFYWQASHADAVFKSRSLWDVALPKDAIWEKLRILIVWFWTWDCRSWMACRSCANGARRALQLRF